MKYSKTCGAFLFALNLLSSQLAIAGSCMGNPTYQVTIGDQSPWHDDVLKVVSVVKKPPVFEMFEHADIGSTDFMPFSAADAKLVLVSVGNSYQWQLSLTNSKDYQKTFSVKLNLRSTPHKNWVRTVTQPYRGKNAKLIVGSFLSDGTIEVPFTATLATDEQKSLHPDSVFSGSLLFRGKASNCATRLSNFLIRLVIDGRKIPQVSEYRTLEGQGFVK